MSPDIDDNAEDTYFPVCKVAIRTKLERQKEEKKRAKAKAAGNGEKRQPSALDRFKKAR